MVELSTICRYLKTHHSMLVLKQKFRETVMKQNIGKTPGSAGRLEGASQKWRDTVGEVAGLTAGV
jgi:hypothetical protein